jgi:hypothetical protein
MTEWMRRKKGVKFHFFGAGAEAVAPSHTTHRHLCGSDSARVALAARVQGENTVITCGHGRHQGRREASPSQHEVRHPLASFWLPAPLSLSVPPAVRCRQKQHCCARAEWG